MPIPAVEPPADAGALPEPLYGDPYQDGQAALRGLIMDTRAGSVVRLMRLNWYGIRSVREEDEERSGMHGVWTGTDLLPELQVPMSLRISARSHAGAHYLLSRITEAFRPAAEPVPLLYRQGGTTYLRWGKPRLLEPDTATMGVGVSVIEAGFVSTDPAYYSHRAVRNTATLPAPGGGIAPPLTPPLALPEQPGGGIILALNRGTWPSPPLLQLTGPWRTPGVTTPSWRLSWDLDLAAGQVLTVDVAAGAAYLGSPDAARPPAAGSSVVADCLLPSGTTRLRMTGTATDPTRLPQLAASWRHAYL
ncbi:hypothetical protein FZ103_00310 [Streptomonospora sp. PA3]|uniref:hypothetical protein n=1 Tax=Streptomonospora sp. PA3 TaxID=2607326 RepID=UPI0012DCB2DE|nr:hypothetical protein [Streptomonospora sp. PA3]MUL39636.1 hypothetical protein [Streptomonospora sp. PA3]